MQGQHAALLQTGQPIPLWTHANLALDGDTSNANFLRQNFDPVIQLARGRTEATAIFMARRIRTQSEFAVKAVPFAATNEARARQHTEVEAYALMMKTPSEFVIQCDQAWSQNEYFYLRLELSRRNLTEEINMPQDPQHPERRSGFDRVIRHRWEIARQLIGALNFIHSLRIVHNDITPNNIMIFPPPNYVKLGDFGEANLAGSWSVVERRKAEREDVIQMACVFAYMVTMNDNYCLKRGSRARVWRDFMNSNLNDTANGQHRTLIFDGNTFRLRADPGFRRLTKFMLADINYRPSSKFLLRILKAGEGPGLHSNYCCAPHRNYFCRDRMHRAIWKNMADAKSRQPLADHFRTSPQEISRTFAIICRRILSDVRSPLGDDTFDGNDESAGSGPIDTGHIYASASPAAASYFKY